MVPRTVPLLVAFAFIATGLLLLDAVVSTDEPIALLDLLGRPGTIIGFLIAGVVTLGAFRWPSRTPDSNGGSNPAPGWRSGWSS
ncbi:hypothetical protein G7085_00160 [Tessaracoccus sp. HDW20]|uniref:hypothetical protein n=1 Tax=Tessaracoccus coleopterorum TaxID=2714950 RepID=UPI0018D2D19C|nr:hypothetical protein [Tessaracoccus coleopterorum]NHB83647.1 hypothetical protein [Tessaracoccus coleopterorum]